MLVDLDYFFAQCEELRNPNLKTKPVVGVFIREELKIVELLVLPTMLLDDLVLIQDFHYI